MGRKETPVDKSTLLEETSGEGYWSNCQLEEEGVSGLSSYAQFDGMCRHPVPKGDEVIVLIGMAAAIERKRCFIWYLMILLVVFTRKQPTRVSAYLT